MFEVKENCGSDNRNHYFICEGMFEYLWKDGTIHNGTGCSLSDYQNAPGYWKTKQEAENFLRRYNMNTERIKQVDIDIAALQAEKKKLLKENLGPPDWNNIRPGTVYEVKGPGYLFKVLVVERKSTKFGVTMGGGSGGYAVDNGAGGWNQGRFVQIGRIEDFVS